MFKKGDKVLFETFGNQQKGEIIGGRKIYKGIPMYKVKILSPVKQMGWLTTIREDDLQHVNNSDD